MTTNTTYLAEKLKTLEEVENDYNDFARSKVSLHSPVQVYKHRSDNAVAHAVQHILKVRSAIHMSGNEDLPAVKDLMLLDELVERILSRKITSTKEQIKRLSKKVMKEIE